MSKRVGDWYQYSGAVHIHTTESDGTKTLEEVIEIGQHTDCDFMMFADHMTLSNRDRGGEGLYGKTLVVIGYEHNDEADHHHYLLFESPKVYPADMTAKEYVAAGARDGALGIMAHPDEIRDEMAEYPPYPWDDWTVNGYHGIELWNQMSEWMECLTRWNKLIMAFSPRKSMVGPTDRILRTWDDLNMDKKFVGIVGVDAHAFPIKIGPFMVEIFPYKVHFRCLRTHVILPEPMSDDFGRAKRQLYDAIRDCRVFGSNMRWGAADTFSFVARNATEKATIGGTLSSADNATIVVELPSRATIELVHNGEKIVQTDSNRLEYRIEKPGIYRVEAWKGDRGWIFSNHIRVGV